MQTKNLKKKGFTLVELVIVVAVIAVLSAILIPTIGCFVEEAKETNDMATVRLLNTALVEDEAANGTPATMTEALAAMDRKGYNIERLTPRSTGEILWDSLNNRFLLRNKDGDDVYRDNTTKETKDVNLWKVAKNATDMSEKYSNYLVLDDSFNGDIGKITTGLDVGENTGITAIRYENISTTAQNVIICTNGGELTVNAPSDTVAHYGTSDKVIITAVADNSYDEYGVVNGNIEITKGHVVIASEAKVESVIATTSDVTIDVKNTTTEVKAKEGINLEGKVDGTTAKTIKYVSTIEELIAAEGEVVLNADLVGGVVFSSGKTIVLDANGHSIKGGIYLTNDENLTIKGNGNFSHTSWLLNVGESSSKLQTSGGTLTVESGTFTAGEACVANMTGVDKNKSTIIINGGTFTSLDNGVFMSNGSSFIQGANWVINGGTFNCNIKTTGYVAMGMYLCNTDVAIINGGTFNVKNGVGIVCRSGKTTINSGVVINIVNDGTVVSGKAGDSKILLNVASYIVRDEKSNYPAGAPEIINNSIYTIVETKDIKAD